MKFSATFAILAAFVAQAAVSAAPVSSGSSDGMLEARTDFVVSSAKARLSECRGSY